ncbi:MAG: DinB family protein [Cytophagaceae bacterium]
MREYFIKLFKYNDWANNLILDTLSKTDIKDPDVYKIFSHVINAQFIWMSRITGNKAIHKAVWSIHPLEDLKKFSKESTAMWLEYLSKLDGQEMQRSISYSNSEGASFQNIVGDMLPHIVNHASYHRGQVNKLIRREGHPVNNTDFITWRRTVKE